MAGATLTDIGERLKAARINADLSQDEVCKMLGVTRQAISSWEGGTRSAGLVQLAQMAAAYVTCAHYLLFGESFKDGQIQRLAQLRHTPMTPPPTPLAPRRQRVRRQQIGAAPARIGQQA